MSDGGSLARSSKPLCVPRLKGWKPAIRTQFRIVLREIPSGRMGVALQTVEAQRKFPKRECHDLSNRACRALVYLRTWLYSQSDKNAKTDNRRIHEFTHLTAAQVPAADATGQTVYRMRSAGSGRQPLCQAPGPSSGASKKAPWPQAALSRHAQLPIGAKLQEAQEAGGKRLALAIALSFHPLFPSLID